MPVHALFTKCLLLGNSTAKHASKWTGCFALPFIKMSINTALVTKRIEASLKQTSIIGSRQRQIFACITWKHYIICM